MSAADSDACVSRPPNPGIPEVPRPGRGAAQSGEGRPPPKSKKLKILLLLLLLLIIIMIIIIMMIIVMIIVVKVWRRSPPLALGATRERAFR